MIKFLYIATLIIIASCGRINNKLVESNLVNPTSETLETTSSKIFTPTDKTVKFLWRDNKYDEVLKDTFNSIIINEDYSKTMTDPERAALGYVATFVGNECKWYGETKDDRSNLKCVILTALGLGYQCSDSHLGFLRQWFQNDPATIKELENCPTTPFTATNQNTFDEITLTVKGDIIQVFFKASGVNLREGQSWSWTETDHFQVDDDNIKLIKKDESEVQHERFDTGE